MRIPIEEQVILSCPLVAEAARMKLVEPVTHTEIRAALWSIGTAKAPGPDGFSSGFYKKAWGIVDLSVYEVVQDFFRTWRMCK